MKQLTADDILRRRATKTRLMKLGWKCVEDFVGGNFYIRISHYKHGGYPALGQTYETAEENALNFASRKQNEVDAVKNIVE